MNDYADVDAAAVAAGLTPEQTARFRSDTASWAMEGMRPTPTELAAAAEVRAGRSSFEDYRRTLGI